MKERFTVEKFKQIIDIAKSTDDIYKNIEKLLPPILYKYHKPFSGLETDDRKKRIQQIVNGEIWFSKKACLNDTFEYLYVNLKSATDEAQEYYEGVVNENEVFCLSASNDNKLMWAHYTEANKGYCLGYKRRGFNGIMPVIYDNEKCDLGVEYQKFFDNKDKLILDISARNDLDTMKNIILLEIPIITKDLCWSYEEEYRLFAERSFACDTQECGSIHSVSRYGLELSEIIVGCNCKDVDVNILKGVKEHINKERYNKVLHRYCNSPAYDPSLKESVKALAEEETHYVKIYKQVINDDLSFGIEEI